MPPKRDIRDFFKQTPAASHSSRNNAPTPKDSKPARKRPSPRPMARESEPIGDTIVVQRSAPKSPARPTAIDTDGALDGGSRPPTTSQTSTNSGGSKRLMVDGQQVVTNSDSDSDELIELDFGPRRPSPRTHTPGANTSRPTTRHSAYKQAEDDDLRKPAKRKLFKPTLSHLIKAAQKNEEAERRIAEKKAELEKPIEETPVQDVAIDENTLAGMVDDESDGDNAKRLYLAMQRTNAHDVNYAYYMFSEDRSKRNSRGSPFPSQCLPRHGWAHNFSDPDRRDQAFLSGFAQHVFRYQDLPEELASWMIDQISLCEHDGLSARYLELLDTNPRYLKSLLNQSTLDQLFRNLGADTGTLDASQEIKASRKGQDGSEKALPPSLKWVLRLIRSASPHLPTGSSGHALWNLFHLAMDESIISDALLLDTLQEAIEVLMCRSAELPKLLDDVLPPLLAHVQHPVLQSKLVRSLPAQSPLTASFKRHLALAFFLYPTPLNVPLQAPSVPALIFTQLRNSPDLVITKETDYIILAARVSLLDIGIGPGLTEVPFQPLLDPSQLRQDGARPPLSNEDIAFNKQVDDLTHQIKVISDGIVETGAMGDMTRLDAKDATERLYHRLGNAVRVGGRKRTDIFGEIESQQRQKSAIEKFLHRTEALKATAASGEGPTVSSDDDFDGVPED